MKKFTFEKAKDLRKRMTVAEKMLWDRLRGKKLGYKFRRQHPIDRFIVDFYCHEKKLVIEIDGGIHSHPDIAEYDSGRSDELSNRGPRVIRYSNEDIKSSLEAVIFDIKKILEEESN